VPLMCNANANPKVWIKKENIGVDLKKKILNTQFARSHGNSIISYNENPRSKKKTEELDSHHVLQSLKKVVAIYV
jgi:hypothetical protein